MIKQLKINKMKKLFLCLVVLVLAFNKGFSQGVGDFVIDNVIYKVLSFDDMTVQALGLENAQTIVTIPNTIEYGNRTFKVTELDFQNHNESVELLTLSEGLEYLNLPKSGISKLLIPSTVLKIDTIKSVNGFSQLYIPSNVDTINKVSLSFVNYLSIDDAATPITFPITSMWYFGAFSGTIIDTLYLGRTCNDVATNFFRDCHIKNIIIGNEVKCIPYFCEAEINQITLPNSIETMGANSFEKCNNLKSVTIEDNVNPIIIKDYYVYNWLFNEDQINSLYLGRNCDRLRIDVFSLHDLTIGPSVNSMHDTFYDGFVETNPIDVFGDSGFVKVYKMTPPEIDIDFSNRTYLSTTLFVPIGTKDLYQQANVWKNFFNVEEFEWDNPQCCVYLNPNVDTLGTVIGQDIYNVGELITVQAIPNDDCVFINWTENDSVVSTNESYCFVADRDRKLIANFASNNCNVIIISPNYQGNAIGEGNYHYGDTVTIMAIPNEEYAFLCWLTYEEFVADTVSFDNPYSFVITEDMKFHAIYTRIPFGSYSVFASSNPFEAGIIIGTGIYSSGTIVTMKAIPNEGYSFVNWTENNIVVSTNAEYQFVIQENRNLTAHFSGMGVDDFKVEIAVYPNPTDGLIRIEEKEFESIEVYNVVGQLIKETKDNVLDLSDQEAGTYIIKVITPSGIITKQIIKK